MSRTTKGKKPPGFEYWKSRLHRGGEAPGPDTKKLTHRKERRGSRHAVETAIDLSRREGSWEQLAEEVDQETWRRDGEDEDAFGGDRCPDE